MRKYEPIWIAIKEAHTVSIEAPVENHNRIIKAVRKEKARDRGFKLLNLEKNLRYKLEEEVIGRKIIFHLVEDKSVYISDLRL